MTEWLDSSLRPRRRWPGRLAVLWLALGPMLMLAPLWAAPTSAGEDDVVYYYPLRVLVGRSLAAGQWPTWNPYAQCGSALFADPQSAVLYPPTWLFAALPAKLAYSLNVFLAFAAAGLGAYAYLRKIGLARPAAAFGATAFQYCGFMIGHRVHLGVICAAAMLGLGLWAIETLRDRPRKALAALPGVLFLALAAGHWPTFVNLMLIWTAYLLVRGRPLLRSAGLAAASLAVALLLAAPQIQATLGLLAQTTRQRVGFAMLGENSFFPANAVLAFFPLLMGCRTQNFFAPQPWWGAWHLCETLGYVGLGTLALAGAGVWRLWRRRSGGPFSGLVRLWALLAVAAGVWMLGYYLPTYRLVQHVPVLNIVRAPARMVLAADFALAALAAIAIHALLTVDRAGPAVDTVTAEQVARFRRSVRRWATAVLPLAMVGALAALALAGWYFQGRFGDVMPFPMSGRFADLWAAYWPLNPALWAPVVVLVVWMGALVRFAARPHRGAAALLAVLVVDLLIVARAVDIPADLSAAVDPADSMSAPYVLGDAGGEPFRVLHLSRDYFAQPADVLAPQTCGLFGVENLAGYGPWQSRDYARLFDLRIFGYSENWPWLVRRNYLLSLYNVRYLLAEEAYRPVIDSVVVPAAPRGPDGPNLLGEPVAATLVASALWRPGLIERPAPIEPGRVYRIALDVRAPEGAAHFLQADIFQRFADGREDFNRRDCQLLVHAEFITGDWRHFEWTFRAPPDAPAEALFRLLTYSERPLEVRNAALRASAFDEPINLGGRLAAGDRVYRLRATMPGREGPVAIYENLLCLPRRFEVDRAVPFASADSLIEELRWNPDRYDLTREALAVNPPSETGRLFFQSDWPAGRAVEGPGRYRLFGANGHGLLSDAPTSAVVPASSTIGASSLIALVAGALAYGWLALLSRTRRTGGSNGRR